MVIYYVMIKFSHRVFINLTVCDLCVHERGVIPVMITELTQEPSPPAEELVERVAKLGREHSVNNRI